MTHEQKLMSIGDNTTPLTENQLLKRGLLGLRRRKIADRSCPNTANQDTLKGGANTAIVSPRYSSNKP